VIRRLSVSTLLGLVLSAGVAGAEDRASANPVKASPADDPVAAAPADAPAAVTSAAAKPIATVAPGTHPAYLRSAPRTPPGAPAPDSGSGALRGVMAFGLIAALGAVALYFRKKRSGPIQLKRELRLHVLGSVQVGPKASVALLSVGHEALLVGVSENGVTALRTFGKDELGALSGGPLTSTKARAVASTPASEAAPNEPSQVFRDLLQSATRSQSAQRPVHAVVARRAADEDDEMPAHLAEVLRRAAGPVVTQVREQAAPPAARSENAFGEAEGQASELVRRFRGLHS